MRYEFSFQAGKPESGFIQSPLPTGPYIRVFQDEVALFVGLPWNIAVANCADHQLFKQFWLEVGHVILADVKGIATMVGAHFDTSD